MSEFAERVSAARASIADARRRALSYRSTNAATFDQLGGLVTAEEITQLFDDANDLARADPAFANATSSWIESFTYDTGTKAALLLYLHSMEHVMPSVDGDNVAGELENISEALLSNKVLPADAQAEYDNIDLKLRRALDRAHPAYNEEHQYYHLGSLSDAFHWQDDDEESSVVPSASPDPPAPQAEHVVVSPVPSKVPAFLPESPEVRRMKAALPPPRPLQKKPRPS